MMKNKRRTLVTMIGVIISVAMITAVATLGDSFIHFALKDHIAREGEWHVSFKDINIKQLKEIEADQKSHQVILTRDLGYSPLEESANPTMPYLFIKQLNTIGFEKIPVEITAGRLPENDQELIIAEHVLKNANVDLSIGDQMIVEIGERVVDDEEFEDYYLGQTSRLISDEGEVIETLKVNDQRKFTIVGIMERPNWEPYQAPGFTALTYLSEASMTEGETVDALVIWDKVSRSRLKHSQKLGETLKISQVTPNENLLRYYGISKHDFLFEVIYSVVAIIMFVIIVGSISLIYNAFAISVSERSQYLGMLSSIGATKKQKRNSILFEGAVIGLVSIPLGIIAGIGGIAVTLIFINSILQRFDGFQVDVTVHVTPLAIVVSIVVAMLTIFISAYIPAVRASRISAIDAIRQAKDIQLTPKKVQTSKLIRKIFGIEGEVALKNLKRNKRRYYATVFSLVISIVLFLTVSFVSDQIRTASTAVFGSSNYDIVISPVTYQTEFTDDFKQTVKNLEDVTKFTTLDYAFFETELLAEQLHESVEDFFDDEKASISVGMYALDEETLREYAKEVGVDYGALIDKERLSGILINTMASQDKKVGEVTSIHLDPGDELRLTYHDLKEEEEIESVSVELLAVTDQRPHGVNLPMDAYNTSMIVSKEVLNIIRDIFEIDIYPEIVLSSLEPLNTQEQLEKIIEEDMHIINLHKNRQEEENMILIMSVFSYGFITLITLISIANIFNTITTSISLRTREFGTLKSIGITPKGFRRMINYESIFYGIKALLFGLPISFGIMYLIYIKMSEGYDYPLQFPWMSIFAVILGVFFIVSTTMFYASSRVKKINVIDALKMDNI